MAAQHHAAALTGLKYTDILADIELWGLSQLNWDAAALVKEEFPTWKTFRHDVHNDSFM